MAIHKQDKINRLLAELPEGVVVPMVWLAEQGYSRQLVNGYVKRGWLLNLGHGVFCKPSHKPDWRGAVLGIQRFLKFNVHVGGVSALNLHGLAHYVPLGESRIHLWGRKIPTWLNKLESMGQFYLHRQSLFSAKSELGIEAVASNSRDWTMQTSTPERAILEVLSLVDDSETDFQFAAELFEGLVNLRPTLLSNLLLDCNRIKAKRLCLFFGAHYQHDWFKRLDINSVDVGKGKRQITKGGKLDKTYQITVPASFVSEEHKMIKKDKFLQAEKHQQPLSKNPDNNTLPAFIAPYRQTILQMAQKNGVKNVRLFGSMVRNQATANSDVDLLVEIEKGKSGFALGGFLMDVSELLHRKVDVVTESALHPKIHDQVLREARPL